MKLWSSELWLHVCTWLHRVVFSWVSKVISELLWFMITSLSDWFKVLAPIVALACTFSLALCRLRVITSSFDWFTGLSPTFLIGQSNYFGFGFTTLNWKLLFPQFNIWFISYITSSLIHSPREQLNPQMTNSQHQLLRGYLKYNFVQWLHFAILPSRSQMWANDSIIVLVQTVLK